MDRTFQARVTIGQYLALLLCTFMAGYGLWNKEWPIALVFMLLLVVIYIPLQDISLAEHVKAPLFGALFVSHYVLVHYTGGKTLALLPVNEEEFLKTLAKRGCKVKI